MPFGVNLFAYCNDNPVMGYDPIGEFDWNVFLTGIGMVIIAVTAITLAVTTFGAGIPLAMTIIAGVTLGAGILTGVNGIATLIESASNYNFVRDGIFNGNQSIYNWYSGITEGIAAIGSMILGIYHTTGQYRAAKYGQDFLGDGYSKVGSNRWVSKDGLRQMRKDFHNPYGKHFNLETFRNNYWLGGRNKIIVNIHLIYKWFSFFVK